MSKIYTKTGDDGSTQLGNGERVAKSSDVISACGCLDELNAFLGLAKVHISSQNPIHKSIQKKQVFLMKLNAKIALASPKETIKIVDDLAELEREIDITNSKLEPLQDFVIPGVNKAVAYLHVARTICRRAERAVVKIKTDEDGEVVAYLNRLSDWLFVAARFMENLNEETAK